MELDAELLNLLYIVFGSVVALVGNFIWNKLKARPDYDEIELMTRRMVEAAQQMWSLDNNQKYEFVKEKLSAWLKTKGWDISPDLIHVFIESAVRLLRREEKFLGSVLDNTPKDEDDNVDIGF